MHQERVCRLSKWDKEAIRRAEDRELVRRVLKQLLFALHKSEGFSTMRLMRVVLEWTEVQEFVNSGSKEDQSDKLIEIDRILDELLPSKFVSAIGREKLKNWKGENIN